MPERRTAEPARAARAARWRRGVPAPAALAVALVGGTLMLAPAAMGQPSAPTATVSATPTTAPASAPTSAPKAAPPAAQAQVQHDEPRAYGYTVGDVVTREIDLDVPPGYTLDLDSLPTTTRSLAPLELRRLRWDRPPTGAGRFRLWLDYQVFFAPVAVRTLEMPPLNLRLVGGDRPLALRVDAWPVTVAPLVPLEVSPRRGLGEAQPDAAPPPREVDGPRRALAASALVATLAALYLALVYVGLPWWNARHRPFAVAWPRLKALGRQPAAQAWAPALKLVHDALDRHHGGVLFADRLEAFTARSPAFAPVAADLREFFARSRRTFFGAADPAQDADLQWLLALARRCRQAERGTS